MTVLGPLTVTAHARTRFNLAVQHMLAAARFSRMVGELETEHKGEQFASFWEAILHCATASVLTAVASLESYANELFADRNQIFSAYRPDLMNELWKTYEQKRILGKFEFALLLLDKPPLDRGAKPYQNVEALIDLRNALTHFKPEWMDEADEHAKISKRLQGKFDGGPFLDSSELLFPRRWAGHGCTTWAVKGTLAFALEFESLAGLPQKYSVTDVAAFEP